jgi:hypothetical protein
MKERVSAFVILAVIMLQVVQVDGFSYALPLRTPRARALAQGHAPTRSCAPVHRTRLLMLKPEDMSVCVVEVHGDDVVIKATVFSDGMERSWTFRYTFAHKAGQLRMHFCMCVDARMRTFLLRKASLL